MSKSSDNYRAMLANEAERGSAIITAYERQDAGASYAVRNEEHSVCIKRFWWYGGSATATSITIAKDSLPAVMAELEKLTPTMIQEESGR